MKSVEIVFYLVCGLLCSSPIFAATNDGIVVHEHVVFDGYAGWSHDGVTYRLACGAVVEQVGNGDLLCWWLSGSDGEPSTDNNVLLSRSSDGGQTWNEPQIFIKADKMAGALTCLYPASNGRLIAFGAQWPSEEKYTVWNYFRMESADNGYTWGERKPIQIHDNHIMFMSPIHLANGEYLFPASFFDKRSKRLVAPVEDLVRAKTEEEALAMPARENGGHHDDKFSTHLHGCSVLISPDANATSLTEYGHIANRPYGLVESTCIQLKDGRIVMLMRAELAGYLWRAESADNGRTWTNAWQTDIPNPTSSIHLVRLADGRIALLHNACGKVGKMIKRDPLSLWISEDEMKTWAIKADILTGGWLAYPHGYVLKDGRFVFVYDRDRRQVRFVEVDLPPAVKP